MADRQIENTGRNQSANVQAQQCIADFTKGRRGGEMKQRDGQTDGRIDRQETGETDRQSWQPSPSGIISPLPCDGLMDVLKGGLTGKSPIS